MKQDRKVAEFDIKDILPIVLIIVVAGIGAAFGLQVMTDVQTDMLTGEAGCNATSSANCGNDYNGTGDAVEGVTNITSKFGIIGSVVAAAIILGILVRYLYNMFA